MLNKIFLGLVAVSIVVMAFLTYYAWSWLQSIGAPGPAIAGYEYQAFLSWIILWLSSTILMVLGTTILWISRHSWAIWTTFLYFATFVLLRFFWLDQMAFHFKKASGMSEGTFSLTPFLGVIMVVAAALVVFVTQFAVVRLHRKMYPPIAELNGETALPVVEE